MQGTDTGGILGGREITGDERHFRAPSWTRGMDAKRRVSERMAGQDMAYSAGLYLWSDARVSAAVQSPQVAGDDTGIRRG